MLSQYKSVLNVINNFFISKHYSDYSAVCCCSACQYISKEDYQLCFAACMAICAKMMSALLY